MTALSNIENIENDVAVVVVSHDGYADVWPGFFELLFRYWLDNPYKIYLISNHLPPPDERVVSILVGDDLSWSRTLARGLERIPSRDILLMLEDFFLTDPVDTARVCRLHDAMRELAAGYLRLMANPPPDVPLAQWSDIGSLAKGAAYRTSLQAAFWDRSVLLGLLRDNESAWDFEVDGSRRSDRIVAPFLSVRDGVSAFPSRQTVRRGKWLPGAVQYFTQLGISFDLSRRPLESDLDVWWQTSILGRIITRVRRLSFRRLFLHAAKS